MKYVVLAIASDAEAQRLIDDLTEHAGEPLRTPRWGNAVHASLITSPLGSEHPSHSHTTLLDGLVA